MVFRKVWIRWGLGRNPMPADRPSPPRASQTDGRVTRREVRGQIEGRSAVSVAELSRAFGLSGAEVQEVMRSLLQEPDIEILRPIGAGANQPFGPFDYVRIARLTDARFALQGQFGRSKRSDGR